VLQSVSFLLSVGDPGQLPLDEGSEVAFAGRSNAGKSSAINAICGRRKLAFTSRTPGRTQVINYFRVDARAHLVDLPGYGYARVPAAVRAGWERLIGGYLRGRRALRGLFLVMDVRHPLTPLDRQMLDWLSAAGCPVQVLLTKADKLSRQAAQRQLAQTEALVASLYPSVATSLFSSVDGTGVEQARALLATWLG
jgi:GTP-binding protein